MKDVFVIIVNFNGGDKVISCLNSIKRERVKIIVVDNGSTDGSVEKIKKYPVKLIRNYRNIGFSSAVNIGIEHALNKRTRAVILLNPDAVAGKGFLGPLISNKADIASPVINFKRNGGMIYDLGGKVNLILGRSCHLESKKVFRPERIDYVTGCCMRINTIVFKKIGLFDEKFFLYWEDVDFCLRAKKAGFKVDIELKSRIFHKLEKINKRSWFSVFHLLRSNLCFIRKCVSFRYWPFAYFYWIILSVKIILVKLLCSRE